MSYINVHAYKHPCIENGEKMFIGLGAHDSGFRYGGQRTTL